LSNYYNMKSIFFYLLFFIILQLSIHSEPKKEPDYRKEVLWNGEVTAVYKNKNRIQVTIYNLNNFAQYGTKQNILKFLSGADSLELKEKDSGQFLANFILKDMHIESLKTKGKVAEVDLVLFGSFTTTDNKKFKKINNNLYIEAFKKYPVYIDSSAYFSGSPDIPTSYIHPTDRKEMVFVANGLFLYGQGSDPSRDNYNPYYANPEAKTLMEVPSFYIDKYEVTNQEYAHYLKETNNPVPAHWINGKFADGKEDHPVIHLTYREVELYANWSGKRIPTEFEWEKAARGQGFYQQLRRDETVLYFASSIAYPFGQKYDNNLCNCAESGIKDTVSVYELSTKGASVYGVIGMCGNAPEWTSSWYTPYSGHSIKNSYFGKIYKVIRGGSYIDNLKECRSNFRAYGGLPTLKEDRRAGFRLVIDYKPR
jgi:formylglycine-generating enzyme required for sulfatase activity